MNQHMIGDRVLPRPCGTAWTDEDLEPFLETNYATSDQHCEAQTLIDLAEQLLLARLEWSRPYRPPGGLVDGKIDSVRDPRHVAKEPRFNPRCSFA